MDKEAIEQRLAELKKALEQVQANGNALIGAIQESEYWLARLAKETPKPAEETAAET